MACKQVTRLPGSLSQLTQGSPTHRVGPVHLPAPCSPNLNLPFPPFSDVLYRVLVPDLTRHLDIQETKTTIMQAAGLARGQGVGQDAQLPAQCHPTEGAATDPREPPPSLLLPGAEVGEAQGWRTHAHRDLCNRNTAHSCRVRLSCDPTSFPCSLCVCVHVTLVSEDTSVMNGGAVASGCRSGSPNTQQPGAWLLPNPVRASALTLLS